MAFCHELWRRLLPWLSFGQWKVFPWTRWKVKVHFLSWSWGVGGGWGVGWKKTQPQICFYKITCSEQDTECSIPVWPHNKAWQVPLLLVFPPSHQSLYAARLLRLYSAKLVRRSSYWSRLLRWMPAPVCPAMMECLNATRAFPQLPCLFTLCVNYSVVIWSVNTSSHNRGSH